jgi:predicted metallopeptidase
MADDKEYEVLEAGNDIVRRLCERYREKFPYVVPSEVVVLLITNVPRPFSMRKLARITKIDAAHRTIMRVLAGRDVRYFIEIYQSDWAQWSPPRCQWIIAHEIAHIDDPKAKGLVQHDIQDFGWLLDAVGIDWWQKDNLPDLLEGSPFPFRQELFDRLHTTRQSEGDGEDRG